MKRHVVVLGGGLNGLVAANKLAQRGLEVTLCEARSTLGGLSAGEEFHPGFRSSGILHDGGALASEIRSGLGLAQLGLVEFYSPARLAALLGDRGLLLHANTQFAAEEIRASFPRDAERYLAWRGFLKRVEPFVRGLLREKLPPLEPNKATDYVTLLQRGIAARRLGAADLRELLRVLPMAAADWLSEFFESEFLRAALLSIALEASWLAPSAAGSSAILLARECTREREVAGGPAAIVRALVSLAERSQVHLRTNSRVKEILVQAGFVQGVALESGEVLRAETVLSTLDPRQTFLDLLSPRWLDHGLVRSIQAWRARGTSAKLHLALDGALELYRRAGEPIEHWTSGASVAELEQVQTPLKYGAMSARLLLDARIPTLRDQSLAPAGKHVLSVIVQGVPHELQGGWTAQAKKALEERVLGQIEEHAPGTRSRILACQTLTPVDLAERYHLAGGHIHHGEMALDQWLFQRPNLTLSQGLTPIAGLILGGASQHPGGGPTGMPGWLAADQVR